MSREEFVKHLEKKDMEFGNLWSSFAYSATREELARVLIELDYALYKAEDRREDYLEGVIEELKQNWYMEEEC